MQKHLLSLLRRKDLVFSISTSVEPFDEAKYKALMDGLECSEIKKSELEFSGRTDAEYYQKNSYSIKISLKHTIFCHYQKSQIS